MKKKKILYVVNGYPSKKWHNNCTFIKSQIDELSKNFEKVYVLVQNPFFPKFLYPFKSIPFSIRSYSQTEDYKYKNIEVYFVNYFTFPENILSNFRSISLFSSIKRLISRRGINFDLIHCHFLWPSGDVGRKLKNIYHVPLILTGHGYDVYDLPSKNNFWRNKIKLILDSSDRLITVSNKNSLFLQDLTSKQIDVVYNGYDATLFSYKKYHSQEEKIKFKIEDNIIISVGNLKPVKNQLLLLKACKILKEKNIDFKCIIIGEGKMFYDLKKYICENDLTRHIYLLGSRKQVEISQYLAISKVFVLPSYSEGNPTVMFEALGMGLPFIGSKVGGIPEVISSPQLGYLFEDLYNPNELSLLLRKALKKNWNNDFIVEYSKKFTWSSVSKEINKVYEECFK